MTPESKEEYLARRTQVALKMNEILIAYPTGTCMQVVCKGCNAVMTGEASASEFRADIALTLAEIFLSHACGLGAR